MTNEERELVKKLAVLFAWGGANDHEFMDEEADLIARCLEIVAGAKVEEGWVIPRTVDGNLFESGNSLTADLNDADFYTECDAEDADSLTPVRRYTFTEMAEDGVLPQSVRRVEIRQVEK